MNRHHLRGATDHKESEKRCFSVLPPCRQFRGVAFKSLGVNTQHADQSAVVVVVVVPLLRPDALVLGDLVGHVHVVLVALLLVLLRAVLLGVLLAVRHRVVAALFVGHLVALWHGVLAAVLLGDVVAFGHLLVVTFLLGDLVTLLLIVVTGLALLFVCSEALLKEKIRVQ